MTYSDDYPSTSTTTIIDEEFDDSADYPTAFGITFTPQVSGIGLETVGLVAMLYVILNFLMPALNDYNQLKQDEADKRAQIDQQSSGVLARKFAEAEWQFKEAEQRKATVLELYADSQDLQTILYNFNGLFQNRDVKLVSFLPQGGQVVIGDDTLGANVKNRLKRQTYQISMLGDFSETLNLIRDLERLQPLVLMKNMQTSLVKPEFPINVVRDGEKVEIQPESELALTTNMTLEVYLPLSPEEILELEPPEPPPGEEAEGG